jgi:hypothetical protein
MTSRRRLPNSGNGGVASAHELQARYEAALDERRRSHGAAIATVEALMFSLREQGEPALTSANNQRRLGELSADQVAEVIARLDQMRDRYPQVSDGLLLRLGEKLP